MHRRPESPTAPPPVGEGRRVRARDVVLALACVGGYVQVWLGNDYAWSVLPDWWKPLDLVGGALAVGALYWRKRHPVAVALVLGVVGGLFLTAMVPTLVSVWTVATLRPLRVALAVTTAHLAIAVPYYLLFPIVPEGMLAWAVVLVLMYTVVVAWGVAVRSRRQVIQGLVDAAAQERREHEVRLGSVRGAERARIAREMHDVLAHRLSLLSVHAGALEYRTQPGRPRPDDAELHESAAVIRDNAHRALEELAEVLHVLRDENPSAADGHDELQATRPQPEVADLPRLVAEARASGQRVELHLPDDAEPLAALRRQAHRTVYRVVQEGLTNARKHAPGAAVEVRIELEPGHRVRASVANPLPLGVGGDEVLTGGIPGAGTGLAGLRERVRIDDGTLTTEVHDGVLTLAVELPWRT